MGRLLLAALCVVSLLYLSPVHAIIEARPCNDQRPSIVTGIKITGYPDPWSLSLSWSAPSQCVDYYYVFVRPGGRVPRGRPDPKPYQILTTDKLNIVVYNLKSSTKYRVDVVAVNKRRGRSAYAAVFPTTPRDPRYPAPPPAQPASKPPATKPPAPNKAPAKPQGGKTPPPPPSTKPQPAKPATPSPAPVRAPVCDAQLRLAAPSNVIANFVAGGVDRVRLTWSAPPLSSCSLLGYKLTGLDAAGSQILETPLTRAERDVTVTGLDYRTQYTFYVTAQSSLGDGQSVKISVSPAAGTITITGSGLPAPRTAAVNRSTQNNSPPNWPLARDQDNQPSPASNSVEDVFNNDDCRTDAEPAAPQSFKATPDGSGRIKLEWVQGDSGTCIDSFKLDGYVLKTGDPVVSTQTGSTSYTLTQLQPGTEYAFTISAVNAKGVGTPATAMATTPKSRR